MNVKYQIINRFQQYDRILLFRHKRIDGDCVGATKGLKGILLATWPEKDVRIIDDQLSDYLAVMGADEGGVAEEAFNQDALAVGIDTADTARVSCDKFQRCKEVIKIDHHIDRTPYGDIAWVEENRSSACEMIAALYADFRDTLRITREAATHIYTGMVTDSGRFMYEGVSGDTLRLAGLMLDQGVDTETLYANLYLKDIDSLRFTAYVYEHMQVTENGVAYLFVDKHMQEKFALSLESASACIGSLSGIRGCLCWIAFIETGDADNAIRVRLRSRFAAINHIAENYLGGGHAGASGATVYSVEEMNELLRDADAYIKEYKETHEGWL